MILSKLGMILFACLCLLQVSLGLLYGLAPDHFLNKIQRARHLQEQEQQLKRLHEAADHQIYFQFAPGQNSPDALQQDVFVRKALAAPQLYAVEFKSSNLMSAMRGSLISPPPSFKYSFIGK
ncbi:hypothetical protein BsWGS_11837 [Bradybaena similaris]